MPDLDAFRADTRLVSDAPKTLRDLEDSDPVGLRGGLDEISGGAVWERDRSPRLEGV
jgi:hypothetical protein